ncbi:DUF1385 domain-containing protein [candidate division KSB1 bacterium]|nr:MAG: DUF1385 domain-containing protein [candidate division KSB1 bacterium]
MSEAQTDTMKQPEDRRDISTELAMGGQALIEGVLMRSPTRVAMAARKADGEVIVREFPYIPITRRIKWLGLPVIRGSVGMVESMRIGIDALNWSAEQAATEPVSDSAKSKWKDKLALGFSMLLGLAIALGLFMYFPLWIGRLAAGADGMATGKGQIVLNLVAGGVRIFLLLGYLWVVSLWNDIRRVFQYHGAEHKSIYAFETGAGLSPEAACRMSRFHPRCGTSFLLIVAVAAVLFFSIVDSLVTIFIGQYPSVLARFGVHILLVPVLAGLSYEILKYSAKNTENRIVKILITPGLWLQRITTREPDESMCAVALTALKTAIGEKPAVVPHLEHTPNPAEMNT